MNEDDLLAKIWDALRTVEDPEIHLDIVSLGLVYNISLKSCHLNTYSVTIEMTLTSPTCPMAPYIFKNIHDVLEILEGIEHIAIELVWNPPWSKDKISEEGKMELGLL